LAIPTCESRSQTQRGARVSGHDITVITPDQRQRHVTGLVRSGNENPA
jgi:hypothetical protein